jgi:hypothetical protein
LQEIRVEELNEAIRQKAKDASAKATLDGVENKRNEEGVN